MLNYFYMPCCLKPMPRNIIKDIAEAIEFEIILEKRTPDEYLGYVEEACPKEESDK